MPEYYLTVRRLELLKHPGKQNDETVAFWKFETQWYRVKSIKRPVFLAFRQFVTKPNAKRG